MRNCRRVVENVDEIDKLITNEMKAHGNESDMMCCMKVTNFLKSWIWKENITYLSCMVFFQNFLDYETFVKLVEMYKKQPSWKKMYFEKIKNKLCKRSRLKKKTL